MKHKLLIVAGAPVVIGAAIAGALLLAYPVQVSKLAGLTCSYLISWSAPPDTVTTEVNAAYKAGPAASTVRRDQVSNLGRSLRKEAETA
jgi:hypothetical protein